MAVSDQGAHLQLLRQRQGGAVVRLGPINLKVVSVYLNPTDFSPIK